MEILLSILNKTHKSGDFVVYTQQNLQKWGFYCLYSTKLTEVGILLSVFNEFAASAAVIHVAVVALSGYDYVVNHLYAKQFAALADTMSEVVVLCAGAK